MNDDFLSQEEIDALLRAAGEDVETGGDDDADNREQDAAVDAALDGELDLLDEFEKDALAEVGNISMGAAATALSNILNRKVSITVPSVTVSTFREVRQRYPIPCLVVTVWYTEGLEGSNVLVIKETDAAILTSLMMGEDGSSPPEELTELHMSAVSEAMNQMMGSSATAMSDMFRTRIQISPPELEQMDLGEIGDEWSLDDPVVVVSFRLEVEGVLDSEMLQLVDVEFARDAVMRLMDPGDADSHLGETLPDAYGGQEEVAAAQWSLDLSSAAGSGVQPPPWRSPGDEAAAQLHSYGELGNLNIELIRNIPVKVRAILGRSRLPIESILRLGPGSIVELDTMDGEPIEVYANDVLVAKGEVVVVGEQFGVRITEIATPRERISTIR
ncbi:MAG: flagellar motor switch phosphatase FliY [Firmicutes bacterium]|nr:flagellar motor switch phosphatase FliY [Bacillota bacterium]